MRSPSAMGRGDRELGGYRAPATGAASSPTALPSTSCLTGEVPEGTWGLEFRAKGGGAGTVDDI